VGPMKAEELRGENWRDCPRRAYKKPSDFPDDVQEMGCQWCYKRAYLLHIRRVPV
jgi:hypothetical protein